MTCKAKVLSLIVALAPVWGIAPPAFTASGNQAQSQLGLTVALIGDMNRDRYDDFAVGKRLNDSTGVDAGRARVYSGHDGSFMYTFCGEAAGDSFGISIAAAGDVNKVDVNCDGIFADVLDVVYLIDYVFNNGPAPCL